MAQPKNFGFGADEQMVRDQAARFLKDNLPVDKLRNLVAHDHKNAYEAAVQPALWDEKLWNQAVALGWTGLAIPEAQGGVGLPLVAVAAVAEEAGRAALPSPLLSTYCASEVLKACDSDGLDDQMMQEYGTEVIAPHRCNRRRENVTQDGRALRRHARRWKIERLFAWLGNYRRLGVRWEYHAENYLGFLHLACALLLLKHL